MHCYICLHLCIGTLVYAFAVVHWFIGTLVSWYGAIHVCGLKNFILELNVYQPTECISALSLRCNSVGPLEIIKITILNSACRMKLSRNKNSDSLAFPQPNSLA